jgi:hypothetical protein
MVNYKNKFGYWMSIDDSIIRYYFSKNNDLRLFYKKDMSIDELLKYNSEVKSGVYKTIIIEKINRCFYDLILKGLECDNWIEYNREKDRNFFFIKEICQSILEKGVTHPMGIWIINVKLSNSDNKYWNSFLKKFDYVFNSENKFFIHPGAFKIFYTYFLDINKVPILLQCDKNNEIKLEGFVEITSANQLKEEILDNVKEPIWVVNTAYSGEILTQPEMQKKFPGSHIMDYFDDTRKFGHFGYDYPYGVRGLEATTPGGDYIQKSWLKDYPVKYCKILKNSFPLNIYIGNCKTDEEYTKCVKTIKNISLDSMKHIIRDNYDETNNEKWSKDRKEAYPYKSIRVNKEDIKLRFKKIDKENIRDIPKINNYRGFCIYTEFGVEWIRDILELFYFTNSEKAFSTNNEKTIIFNTEHPMWKFTTEFIGDYGLAIPEHYEV